MLVGESMRCMIRLSSSTFSSGCSAPIDGSICGGLGNEPGFQDVTPSFQYATPSFLKRLEIILSCSSSHSLYINTKYTRHGPVQQYLT